MSSTEAYFESGFVTGGALVNPQQMAEAVRQIRRMATVNQEAKAKQTFNSNYRTWQAVYKDFYDGNQSLNKAWSVHK